MSERNLKHWFKLAFKLLVSTEWEAISERVEDGDVTYRWIKEQLIAALQKIESDNWGKGVANAAFSLNERLKILGSSVPEEDDFQQAKYWLKNYKGKSVLTDSSHPIDHRVIGAKLALLEVAFVNFDEPAKAGSYFCQIIDALYEIEDIEAAIDEKSNPELAAKVKVIYDCAKEYADAMKLEVGDWTEMVFTPEGLPKESPPSYQPPEIWVFGNFGKRDGEFYYPQKLQIDAEGNFLVLDQNVSGEGTVQRLQLFSPKGKLIKVLLKRGDGKVHGMEDFCLDKSGNIVVCDSDPDAKTRIMVFDYDANQLLSINVSLDEQDPDKTHKINSVFVDDDGLIYAADCWNYSIQVYSPDGKLKLKFGEWGRGDGQFLDIQFVCVKDGNIYATSLNQTQVFDASGNFLSFFGSKFGPSEFLFDSTNDQIYAVCHNDHKIELYDLEGNKKKETEGSFGTGLDNFWFPSSAVLMADGRLAVAERENHRIKVFKF